MSDQPEMTPMTSAAGPPPAPCCPECGEFPTHDVGEAVFAMMWTPTYDAEGRRHTHDPNGAGWSHVCKNGHHFLPPDWSPCWCGWGRNDA